MCHPGHATAPVGCTPGFGQVHSQVGVRGWECGPLFPRQHSAVLQGLLGTGPSLTLTLQPHCTCWVMWRPHTLRGDLGTRPVCEHPPPHPTPGPWEGEAHPPTHRIPQHYHGSDHPLREAALPVLQACFSCRPRGTVRASGQGPPPAPLSSSPPPPPPGPTGLLSALQQGAALSHLA